MPNYTPSSAALSSLREDVRRVADQDLLHHLGGWVEDQAEHPVDGNWYPSMWRTECFHCQRTAVVIVRTQGMPFTAMRMEVNGSIFNSSARTVERCPGQTGHGLPVEGDEAWDGEVVCHQCKANQATLDARNARVDAILGS